MTHCRDVHMRQYATNQRKPSPVFWLRIERLQRQVLRNHGLNSDAVGKLTSPISHKTSPYSALLSV